MSIYVYAFLAAGSALWAAPFPLFRTGAGSVAALDVRARWGVVMQCISYSLLWQGSFWSRESSVYRLLGSALLFGAASALSWSSASALRRYLRVDAAVSPTHELVRSGPYAIVRHPIYTSMGCVLLATGTSLHTPWSLMVSAAILFCAGTAIRIRIEERLLAARFGSDFQRYASSVPAFLPWPTAARTQ